MATYEVDFNPASDSSLAKIAEHIRPETSVLELGPATGYFSRYLNQSLRCTVDGVEYSSEMAEKAMPYFRNLIVGDLDLPETLSAFAAASYDYIVAADVLEHLKDPWKVTTQLKELLKPGGTLLVSLPNVGHSAIVAELLNGRFEYQKEGLLDETHLRFFTRQSAIKLLVQTGFRISGLERVIKSAATTEFSQFLEKFPLEVRSYLLKGADSTTYQFVLKASPGTMTPSEIEQWTEKVLPEVPEYRAEIFWAPREEEFHLGEGAVAFGLAVESTQTLRFPLPKNKKLGRLQFSPIDRPGIFRLHTARLVRTTGDHRVVIWESTGSEIGKKSNLLGMHELSGRDSTFSAMKGANAMVVELPEEVETTEGSVAFELEIDWPVTPEVLFFKNTLNQQLITWEEKLIHLKRELARKDLFISELQGERINLIREIHNLRAIVESRSVQFTLRVKAFLQKHSYLKAFLRPFFRLMKRAA